MALRRLTKNCRFRSNPITTSALRHKLQKENINNDFFNLYPRNGSTHKSPQMFPNIECSKSAHKFVARLDEKERSLLLEELSKHNQKTCTGSEEIGDPSRATVTIPHLKNVFLYNGLPFIGFGFLDNFVMIVAGEYIDVTLGVAFGISTMAAAALGNLISDIAGLGTAGYMESMVGRIGITHPELTIAQASLWQTRLVSLSGRVLGITVGCIIGMVPLLFFHKKSEDKETEDPPATHDSAHAQAADSSSTAPTVGAPSIQKHSDTTNSMARTDSAHVTKATVAIDSSSCPAQSVPPNPRAAAGAEQAGTAGGK